MEQIKAAYLTAEVIHIEVSVKYGVRIFRAAVYDENNRVCWGPLQTRKEDKS